MRVHREAGIRHKMSWAGKTALGYNTQGAPRRSDPGGAVDWNRSEARAEWTPVASCSIDQKSD